MTHDEKIVEVVAAHHVLPRVKIYPLREVEVIGPIGIVKLTQDRFAIVDAEDAARVGERNWTYRLNGKHPIPFSRVRLVSGVYKPMTMHRYILNAAPGTIVDHINGDTLDNRRANLRFASAAENVFNSRRRDDNTSGYKGVSYHKREGKWAARIQSGEIRRYLGSFDTPEEAYAAYCEAAKILHGDFARLA